MNGLLLVLKPPGMTSHDVVDFVRRQTGEKAGHAGTLDPAAAGLLGVALGSATRLARYMVGHDKNYRAEITFGVSTDTGDAEGQVTARAEEVRLTEEAVAAALASLTGTPRLAVPVYSAVKQGGKALHRKVRAGQAVEAPEREMRVHSWSLRELSTGPPVVALTDIDCGAGTYVRSLVTALGARLETPAYLSFLVRTRLGPWGLEQGRTLEEIAAAGARHAVAELALTPAQALRDLPRLTMTAEAVARIRHGNEVGIFADAGEGVGEVACILAPGGELVAVARLAKTEDRYVVKPETVLAES